MRYRTAKEYSTTAELDCDALYWRAGLLDFLATVLTDPATEFDNGDRLICKQLLADIRDSEGVVLTGAFREWQTRWPVKTDQLVRIARARDAADRRPLRRIK